MNTESHDGIISAGKTEDLWDKTPLMQFVYHKLHMEWPGRKPGLPLWEADA
jgi:hypothetical protein